MSGAPIIAAPESAAVTPATVLTPTSLYLGAIPSIRPVSPYTPASPEQTNATVLPFIASSNAITHLSYSFVIGVERHSLSGHISFIRSVYTV